jgi:ribonuclease Z
MKLFLLGTAGYHPNDQRHTACFMIPEAGIMLDAGTSAYRARKLLRTSELDIFLSHAHLDHVIGLTFLLDVLAHKKVDRVTVHGTADKLAAVEEHLFSELLFPVKAPCEFRPLVPRVPLSGGGMLTHFPLQHPGGAVGYRLDWPGRSLAYVTDTTATADASYLDAITGVDVLVHECYFPDSMAEMAALTGHSVTTKVAEVARNARVGRLILVHVDPAAEGEDPLKLGSALAIFPETVLGQDGMEVEF